MIAEVMPIKFFSPQIMVLNQAHAFKKRFYQVKVKYGSNQLVKVGAEDGLSLHSFFGYCQHMIKLNNLQNLELLMSMFCFQFHFDSDMM